jgi:hypothetical protein
VPRRVVISTHTGFTKRGIEKVGMLMTRGVLLDAAALKGVETLPDDYEIQGGTGSTVAPVAVR